MPNQPKTPARPVRLADELWAQLDSDAQRIGSDRSSVIRQLVAWWIRTPGARMPPRPPASCTSSDRERSRQ